jgi:hypothetical protein
MVRICLMLARLAPALLSVACGSTPAAPVPSTPAPATAATASFTVTFGENPVPFRVAGCNAATPQGWYTTARLQETAGVAFTPSGLIQKLDGNINALLAESFNSRFGACTGGAFTPGTIAASSAVCGSVGICTTGTFGTYQFQITGTDANGHAVTFDSPVLQLSAR